MSIGWSWVRGERRNFWVAVLALCAIAVAISIRRLSILAVLDAVFAATPQPTGGHALAGLVLVMLIPIQFSAGVRRRHPRVHRWLGRFLVVIGTLVGVSAYGMMLAPVGGWVETSATSLYGTAFLAALVTAWWHIRRGDIMRHREWMIRTIGIALGIATTRPVMGFLFATSRMTGLKMPQFFGIAMWIGFTSTVLAAEWYIRSTRQETGMGVSDAVGT